MSGKKGKDENWTLNLIMSSYSLPLSSLVW